MLDFFISRKSCHSLTDFKAIEAAIMKNKAYNELLTLSDYAIKHYPKTTLGTYHEALYYEKSTQISTCK